MHYIIIQSMCKLYGRTFRTTLRVRKKMSTPGCRERTTKLFKKDFFKKEKNVSRLMSFVFACEGLKDEAIVRVSRACTLVWKYGVEFFIKSVLV